MCRPEAEIKVERVQSLLDIFMHRDSDLSSIRSKFHNSTLENLLCPSHFVLVHLRLLAHAQLEIRRADTSKPLK